MHAEDASAVEIWSAVPEPGEVRVVVWHLRVDDLMDDRRAQHAALAAAVALEDGEQQRTIDVAGVGQVVELAAPAELARLVLLAGDQGAPSSKARTMFMPASRAGAVIEVCCVIEYSGGIWPSNPVPGRIWPPNLASEIVCNQPPNYTRIIV